MSEEILYLVAFNKQTKKWRSADDLLGLLVNSVEGEGPVRVINEKTSTVGFREIEGGLEKDIDYDNTILLSAFIRDVNGQER